MSQTVPIIVFTGVGKTPAELAQAIDLGVKTINAESEGELERIDLLARERQTRARVALRVNPDIDARSHPYISTGRRHNKFGVAIGLAAGTWGLIERSLPLGVCGVIG